jgi:hypothetical protein
LYDSSLWAEPETFRFMGEAEAEAGRLSRIIFAGG